jgi:dihydropteroate synthase
MGILNITQTHFTMEASSQMRVEIQVDKMLAEGATFIDVEHIQVNLMLNLYLRTQK